MLYFIDYLQLLYMVSTMMFPNLINKKTNWFAQIMQ